MLLLSRTATLLLFQGILARAFVLPAPGGIAATRQLRSSHLLAYNAAEDFTSGAGDAVDADIVAETTASAPYSVDPQEDSYSSGAKYSGTYFVAGATGFVGSEVCKQLIEGGASVKGLSRGGMPDIAASWVSDVEWITGNPLFPETYESAMAGCDAAISCVGGFGQTDAYLRLVNGDCNLKVLETAKQKGVKRFVFVSVHDYKLPRPVTNAGYFAGKREVEKEIQELYRDQGFILKPAFIYGDRKVPLPIGEDKKISLPLQRIGSLAENILKRDLFKTIAKSGLPLADVAYTLPLSVQSVAEVAAKCAAGKGADEIPGARFPDQANILDVEAMEIMSS